MIKKQKYTSKLISNELNGKSTKVKIIIIIYMHIDRILQKEYVQNFCYVRQIK